MSNQVPTETTEKVPAWKQLQSWNELTRELELPADLSFAISTRRVELLSPLRERLIVDSDACNDYALPLLHVVELLLETNQALVEHAAQVAERAQHVEDALESVGVNIGKLRTLAEFNDPESFAGDV